MTLLNNLGVSMRLVFALATLLLISGCASVRVADLTLISTKNTDLSNVQIDMQSGKRGKGEDCLMSFLFIPLGSRPNLENAVDDLLNKNQGNLVIDEVTFVRSEWYILFSKTCIDVEGTVFNTASLD